MVIIDDYRKSWALRYIREARDELKMAQKDFEIVDLIVDAARKAQAAVYHSLGEPSSIESIVNEVSNETCVVANPVLRCLVEIERTVQRIRNSPLPAGKEDFIEVGELVKIASKIVDLLISED